MDNNYHSIYEVPVETMDGNETTLKPYQNQVMLIVNVASRCGFTPQYKELETLHKDYKEKGFSVIGFPCNQFFHQEPGSHEEIKAFAESCYNVTFPLFAKIDVKGAKRAPLYEYIAKNIQKKPLKFVPWNFTKFLVDTQGNVVKQYLPMASFKKIRGDIETLLPQ
ncbi:glutathione peroxidase [Legionella jamestowniensis]|uniref:Glutathione peroxidase n=1 Tax=Legionella jamestowniensis TaxID=455 RepID=A0A0W0UFZ4_9GAMM|nr:glutathione peroxidase [Legionella jamestowniensis]KTD06787.1 glutathione peroxidase [Legionella jamestowniensis]OCH97240.1 glutathione peroxidase [Legionella jamestowniensis]SFL83283.1 glutathione peroxidase [Legionella jamestowniensis DSM 19215]